MRSGGNKIHSSLKTFKHINLTNILKKNKTKKTVHVKTNTVSTKENKAVIKTESQNNGLAPKECYLNVLKAMSQTLTVDSIKDQYKQNEQIELIQGQMFYNKVQKTLVYGSVPSDGHCLFSSLALLLRPIGSVTVQSLRRIVADRFLDTTDKEATEVIMTWFSLVQDILKNKSGDKNESWYRHLWHLKNVPDILATDTVNNITVEQRLAIFNNINTANYWGDEFAISTLQNRFKIGLVILNGDTIKLGQDITCVTTASNSNMAIKQASTEIDNFVNLLNKYKLNTNIFKLNEMSAVLFLYHTKAGSHFEPIVYNNEYTVILRS